jgi:4a-hydroxytetrahydrobiopterin dehydratase
MDRLSDDAVAAGLVGLPGWERVGDTIEATFTLRSFPAAVECIVAIADRAEAMNHHPDLDLRYRRLRVVCSTHDAGGLTELDLTLAAAVSAIAGELA